MTYLGKQFDDLGHLRKDWAGVSLPIYATPPTEVILPLYPSWRIGEWEQLAGHITTSSQGGLRHAMRTMQRTHRLHAFYQ